MRVIALEIPDDPAALPGWLERQLVGLDLAALVAELEAIHDHDRQAGSPDKTLDELLGQGRGAMLERGLSALPSKALRRLLHRPRLLLELQALVLFSGAAYWRQLAETSDVLDAPVERGRRRLAEITGAAEKNRPVERAIGPAIETTTGPVAWHRHPWFVSLATAAAVLSIVIASGQLQLRFPRPVANAPATTVTGWGWSRPGALPQDLPRAAYLDHLADAAEDWFQKRPDDPIALARRIAEFRQGCSVLILSTHRPLSPEDRSWLIAKCRAWAAKLDAHLAAVEAGVDPAKVRADTDEMVHRLITALRERARGQA